MGGDYRDRAEKGTFGGKADDMKSSNKTHSATLKHKKSVETNNENFDIVVKLLPKQWEFMNSTKKFILYSGGRGSGKSQVLAYKCFEEASKPDNEVLLARKQLSDLKDSTLVSLLGRAGGQGGVIPPSAIEFHNKTDCIVKIKGGGVIKYRGLDKGSGVRSMNTGCILLDEVTEFNESEFEEMCYGLRNPHGSLQVFMATNPGAPDPSNFLYRKFFIEKNDDTHLITTSSYDNWHLPKSYFESFKHMDPSRKRRMVEGLWVAIDGTVFSNFENDLHVKSLVGRTYEDYILSIDWGQTHISALVLAGVNKGEISVIEEYGKSGMLLKNIKDKILDMKSRYNNLTILYDPSAPILANELGNIGINLLKANNDRSVGIDRMRNRFGESTLLIDDKCTGLIRELQNYVYKSGSDQPIKVGDDFIDATRYIVNYVDDLKGSYIYPQFLETTEDINSESHWEDISNCF
jgi:PBSX family phage terminase large subunit